MSPLRGAVSRIKSLKTAKNLTLFLDRDGVLNKRKMGAYVQTPEEFVWLDGVLPALARLRKHFRRMVVVTNQQGIGKGLMKETDLEKIHRKLLEDAKAAGGEIDEVYFCPHLKSEGCDCRKPRPLMAQLAREDFPEIKFEQAVMVGDTASDLAFGAQLGMFTVWVNQGTEPPLPLRPDLEVKSLAGFADWIYA